METFRTFARVAIYDSVVTTEQYIDEARESLRNRAFEVLKFEANVEKKLVGGILQK